MIRNNTYTIFNGKEVELENNHDSTFTLRFRGTNAPKNFFQTIPDVYVNIVSQDQVTCAFSVTTHAQFAGQTWQVDRKDGNLLRLSIGYNVDVPNLRMVDRGWYEIWVDKREIEKIWEERKESGYNFPFPTEVPRISEIDLKTL